MADTNFAQLNSADSSPMRPLAGGSFVKAVLLPSVIILTIILAGVGTGWFLSNSAGGAKKVASGNVEEVEKAPGAEVSADGSVGIDDEETFGDTAEGMLEDGGIEGEGSHHLVRGADVSKHVYLTSSAVDLDEFIGKKIQVWGETQKGQKAGWLMDVGKIKVLE